MLPPHEYLQKNGTLARRADIQELQDALAVFSDLDPQGCYLPTPPRDSWGIGKTLDEYSFDWKRGLRKLATLLEYG